MIMEKKEKGFSPDHGDWRYAVIGSTGALVKDGAVESCAATADGREPTASISYFE